MCFLHAKGCGPANSANVGTTPQRFRVPSQERVRSACSLVLKTGSKPTVLKHLAVAMLTKTQSLSLVALESVAPAFSNHSSFVAAKPSLVNGTLLCIMVVKTATIAWYAGNN